MTRGWTSCSSSRGHCGYRFCLSPSQFCRWLLYSPLLSQLQSVRSCRWYLLFLRTVSVSMSEPICPSCLVACCRFSGTFRTVLYSCPILLYYLRFQEAMYVCARRGMLLLLLALPILFQRYLRCWSWCFKPWVMWTFFSNTLNFASLCIMKLPFAWFGEDINMSTSSGSTLAMIRLTTGCRNVFSFFLLHGTFVTPIRNNRVNTGLIQRMIYLKW